jgi:hypothetical protein
MDLGEILNEARARVMSAVPNVTQLIAEFPKRTQDAAARAAADVTNFVVAFPDTVQDAARSVVDRFVEPRGTRPETEPFSRTGARLRRGVDALRRDLRREGHSPEDGVFLMMKFPTGDMDAPRRKCLDEIYAAISGELLAHGLVAKRADDKDYSDQIWDNICIYMLGCKYGIAILEDQLSREPNANVTLEYGYMKAAGKEVALLKEARFSLTADTVGLITKEFRIDVDDLDATTAAVSDAIRKWSVNIGREPRSPQPRKSLRTGSPANAPPTPGVRHKRIGRRPAASRTMK